MNSTFKTLSLTLVLTTFVCAPALQAVSAHSVAKYSATALVLASAAKYCFTKPTEDADRYNLCELSNGQNVANNAYYLYVDGFLGHDEKEVGFEVINPDTKSDDQNVVIKKKKISARGIVGKLHANYLKPFTNVVCFIVALRTIKTNFKEGFTAWDNFSFGEFFTLENPPTTAASSSIKVRKA